MAQLVVQSLSSPEMRSSIPVIGNFYVMDYNCIFPNRNDENKGKEDGNGQFEKNYQRRRIEQSINQR